MTYIVNCTLGECEPSFLHHNESHVLFEVKNYSMLNVCLTAKSICYTRVIAYTEVIPERNVSPVPPVTSVSVSTTAETALPSTVRSGML